MIGRPVGVLLVFTPNEDDTGQVFSYGNIKATVENARKAVDLGVDLLNILAWGGDTESIVQCVKDIKNEIKNEAIIE